MTARPLCRFCGKPIPKRTTTVMFGKGTSTSYWRYIDAKPRTKEEAQRLVNEQVVSVRRGVSPEFISYVGVWDGKSFTDPYFCSNPCAHDFAHMIAKERPTLGTDSWVEALEKQKEKT